MVCNHSLSAAGSSMLQLHGMRATAINAAAVRPNTGPAGPAQHSMPQMLYEITWQASSSTSGQVQPDVGQLIALRSGSSKQLDVAALRLTSMMQTMSNSQQSRLRLQLQSFGGRRPVGALTASGKADQAAMWAMMRTLQQECPQIAMTGVDDASRASDALLHIQAAGKGMSKAADGYG